MQCFPGCGLSQGESGISLTYFEFGTLAAMQLFSQAGVDIAILEVGLGGRLDAVNIFDADCAVLTSIDLDHMDYLGDTREKIGFEKAGIFRSGKTAICSEPNVPETVRRHANSHRRKVYAYWRGFRLFSQHGRRDPMGLLGDWWEAPFASTPCLRGAYQLNNASACLAALDALRNNFPVTMSDVRQGLLEVTLPGRFHVLPGRPVTVLDVAHNPGAAHALAINLASMGRPQKTYAVFAMLRDKDIASVARALASKVDIWLTAGIDAPRGASADEVMRALGEAEVTGAGKTIRLFSIPLWPMHMPVRRDRK